MDDREQVKQLLARFLHEGLVAKSLDGVLGCIGTQICGIGVGEQGFVNSLEDIRSVYSSGLKPEGEATHTVDLGRVEIVIVEARFAFVCADVLITSRASRDDGDTHTQFQQSLSMSKASGEWKICGLHATTPAVTAEALEAYPLYFAEKIREAQRIRIREDYDSVTGLLNRPAMSRAVNRRNSSGGILLIIDVCNCQAVIQRFGEAAIDQLFVKLTQLLHNTFGEVAILGKLEVDRFGVFLPGQRPGSALEQRTAHLLEQVRGISLDASPDLHPSVGIGVAHLEQGDFEQLYQLADEAVHSDPDASCYLTESEEKIS